MSDTEPRRTRDGRLIVGWMNVDAGSFCVIDPDEFAAGDDFVAGLMENANPHLGGGTTIQYQGEARIEGLDADPGFELIFERKPRVLSPFDAHPGQEADFDYQHGGRIRTLFVVDPCYIMGYSDRSEQVRYSIYDQGETRPGVWWWSGMSTGGDGGWGLEASDDGLRLRCRIEGLEADTCDYFGRVALDDLPADVRDAFTADDGRWVQGAGHALTHDDVDYLHFAHDEPVTTSCRRFWTVERLTISGWHLADPRFPERSRMHADVQRFCDLHDPGVDAEPPTICARCGGNPTADRGHLTAWAQTPDGPLCNGCQRREAGTLCRHSSGGRHAPSDCTNPWTVERLVVEPVGFDCEMAFRRRLCAEHDPGHDAEPPARRCVRCAGALVDDDGTWKRYAVDGDSLCPDCYVARNPEHDPANA